MKEVQHDVSNGHKAHYLYNYQEFIPDKVSAKSFPAEVADQFINSDKVEASKLINMCYNDKENIRQYIIKMSNLVSKLKALTLKLYKEILVHFILVFFSYTM